MTAIRFVCCGIALANCSALVGQGLTYTCIEDTVGQDMALQIVDPAECGTSVDYAPDDYTHQYTVKLNFHFMLSDLGLGNFTSTGDNNGGTYNGNDYVNEIVAQANAHLTVNWPMHLPPGNTTPNLPLKYSIGIAGVYYHTNSNYIHWSQVYPSGITGREVRRFVLSAPQGQTVWDVSQATSGVYTVELENAHTTIATEKLILRQ